MSETPPAGSLDGSADTLPESPVPVGRLWAMAGGGALLFVVIAAYFIWRSMRTVG